MKYKTISTEYRNVSPWLLIVGGNRCAMCFFLIIKKEFKRIRKTFSGSNIKIKVLDNLFFSTRRILKRSELKCNRF